jgi:ribose transport system permease protein
MRPATDSRNTAAVDSLLQDTRPKIRARLEELLSRYALLLVWVAMAGVFAILRPEQFFSRAVFSTIFGSQSVLVVLTLALVVTLAVGEFDLSVASVLGLSATMIATLNVEHGIPVGWATIVALISGVLVGTVNGLLVVRVGVDALVATLGMGTFLVGVSMWMSNSLTIGGVSKALVHITTDRFLGLPHSFYFGIALAAIVWYVFDQTPLGRQLLFVGSGREVARLAGIRVNRIRHGAFIVSGFVSALAGVVVVGTLGAFQASQAPSYLLPAFAAAFLGTTVVRPGRFNPWGSVIAIYFLITGITGLVLMGLSGWINQVFYGSALVLAVTVSATVRRQALTRRHRAS